MLLFLFLVKLRYFLVNGALASLAVAAETAYLRLTAADERIQDELYVHILAHTGTALAL